MFRNIVRVGVILAAIVMLAPDALAQWIPEDLNIPGFKYAEAVGACIFIVTFINLLKEKFGLHGKPINYVAGGLSCVYAAIFYQAWESPGKCGMAIVAWGVVFIGATGGWSGAKRLAHKMGPKEEELTGLVGGLVEEKAKDLKTNVLPELVGRLIEEKAKGLKIEALPEIVGKLVTEKLAGKRR